MKRRFRFAKAILLACSLVLIFLTTTVAYHKTQQSDINYFQGHRAFEKGKFDKAIALQKISTDHSPNRVDALRDLAYSYQWTGRHSEAVSVFRKILLLKPNDTQTKISLAETLSWQKKYEEATALYQEVIDKTDDIGARLSLAEIYEWENKPEKAKALLQDVLSEKPDSFRAKLLFAKALLYSGESEKATALFEELARTKGLTVGKTGDDEEIQKLLGDTYIASKDYDKAIAQYRRVYANDPRNVNAWIRLADILSWAKKYDESIQEYKRALEIQPNNLEVMRKLAQVCVWNKDFEQAEKTYKKILGQDPSDMKSYTALGEILSWQKRYNEAIRYFDIALSKTGDTHTELLYGEALLYSADYEHAAGIFERILKKDPKNMRAKADLADTFAYQKQFQNAIKLYRELLSEKDDLMVKRKLADTLSWARLYPEAIRLYDEILAGQEIPEIRRQKARVLGWERKYRKALQEYRLLVKKDPDPIYGLEMKAKEAYWNNRVKRAIRFYSELIQKDPTNVEAMFDLSQIYSYQSIWEKAETEYQKILRISPNHFRAQEGLEKMGLIRSRISMKPEYEFFKAKSSGRDVDIRRHSFSDSFTFPLTTHLTGSAEQKITVRSFSDFPRVMENESRVGVAYIQNPNWWVGGFYDLILYNKGINPMHTFGETIGMRVFDIGTLTFSHERERLENSSQVICDHYFSDNFKERFDLDVTKRLKAGGDYTFALYSHDNYRNEPGFDILYFISLDPKRLSVKYRYFYKSFQDKVPEYFSPKGFSTNSFLINWRHYLNKEEIFFGANDLYYDFKYEVALDSTNIVSHRFEGEVAWDITKRLNFSIKGFITNTSAAVYQDTGADISFHYYF